MAKPANKKPAASKSREVAPRKTTALTNFNYDPEAMTAEVSGNENITASDLTVPRITVLQQISPQCIKDRPEFIKGAEPGIICDVSIKALLGKEITVIPCGFANIYLEWAPRKSGRGLVMNHGTNPAIMSKTKRNDDNENVLPNKNIVVQTATHYCLLIPADGDAADARRCFIPMSSTQFKVAKDWNTAIMAERATGKKGKYTPARYLRAWTLGTTSRTNNEGTWFLFNPVAGPTTISLDDTGELVLMAKAFAEQIKNDLVKLDTGSMNRDEGGGSDNSDAM